MHDHERVHGDVHGYRHPEAVAARSIRSQVARRVGGPFLFLLAAALTACASSPKPEIGTPAELRGMTAFCIVFRGHETAEAAADKLIPIVQEAMPRVHFEVHVEGGTRCTSPHMLFYDLRSGYGAVTTRPRRTDASMRIVFDRTAGGITIGDFLAEFVEAWRVANGLPRETD